MTTGSADRTFLSMFPEHGGIPSPPARLLRWSDGNSLWTLATCRHGALEGRYAPEKMHWTATLEEARASHAATFYCDCLTKGVA